MPLSAALDANIENLLVKLSNSQKIIPVSALLAALLNKQPQL